LALLKIAGQSAAAEQVPIPGRCLRPG